jgi:divalent metal cation (Fe/Co/Zn/Cd) transporter
MSYFCLLQDHKLDILTNSVGLAAALLADWSKWWIDPAGAILLALYTISNWSKTLLENAGTSLPIMYMADHWLPV